MSVRRKNPDAMLLAADGGHGGALSLPLVLDDACAQDSARAAELEQLVTECFEQLAEPVFRYVRGYVRDAPVARELTQEVFVRLCTELTAGRVVTDVRAWLFRVAHNLAIDEQRRLRVREAHESPGGAEFEFLLPDPAPSAELALLRREQHGWLRAALPRLSAQERRCLFLRAQGLHYREIGEVLDIKIPTVVTFLTRAIQKLTKARP